MPMSRPLSLVNPSRLRTRPRSFGWIDHRLRSEGFLQCLSRSELELYIFLALAADAQGMSCWRLDRIELALAEGVVASLQAARSQLVSKDLIAFKPWSSTNVDGVYQILTVPAQAPQAPRGNGPVTLGDCLSSFKSV